MVEGIRTSTFVSKLICDLAGRALAQLNIIYHSTQFYLLRVKRGIPEFHWNKADNLYAHICSHANLFFSTILTAPIIIMIVIIAFTFSSISYDIYSVLYLYLENVFALPIVERSA